MTGNNKEPAPLSYKDLKKTLGKEKDKPGFSTLSETANTVFALKRGTDVAAALTFGMAVMGAGLAGTLLPWAVSYAAAFSAGGAYLSYKRKQETGLSQPKDTQALRGYKTEFNKAARSAMETGIASSVLWGAAMPSLLWGIVLFLTFSPWGQFFMWVGIASAAGGTAFGLKSHKDHKKMNVYEAAIRKESLKNPSPSP